MITDSGDITDESFNQITWETVCAYGDANGVEYEYYKPAEDTDEERINSIDLAVSEGATVVVMPGYLFGPAIAEEQDTYPDVTFIAVDVTEGDIVKNGKAVDLGKNVYICSFEEEQAGYLAGYAAVKDGYTYYYFKLEGLDALYVASISINDGLPMVKAGDQISLSYREDSSGYRQVSQLEIP